jgi:Zn-dependent peptidase ImmA (M78 family)
MTADGYLRFGSRNRFAIEVRLLDDPDPIEQAPLASVGSWGQWRMFVAGLDLTEHRWVDDDGESVRADAVTWYLAPLLCWIAVAWEPLLHEERLPGAADRPNARSAYLRSISSALLDPGVAEGWQAWAARHSLRFAAEGGMFPDLFLRRLRDDIEFSWGDRAQPGVTDIAYAIGPGSAICPVAHVAPVLDKLLAWAVEKSEWMSHRWHLDFRAAVANRASTETRLVSWFLDRSPEPGPLALTYSKVRNETTSLAVQARSWVERWSPEVAMFGSLSPRISQAAAAKLMAHVANAGDRAGTRRAIEEFVESVGPLGGIPAWRDGHERALELLDRLGLASIDDRVDVEGLCRRLGIEIFVDELSVDGPRGVALAGEGVDPTIVVNSENAFNRGDGGRRFTIAHELCHILHDRDDAKRVVHGSGDWAPAVVEQRANAFAAMFLMPPVALRDRIRTDPATSLDDIVRWSEDLGVGRLALIRHLRNLDLISREMRDRLEEELER